MSKLEELLKQYNEVFGEDIPEGAIDEDVLIELIEKALKENKPIKSTDDFVG